MPCWGGEVRSHGAEVDSGDPGSCEGDLKRSLASRGRLVRSEGAGRRRRRRRDSCVAGRWQRLELLELPCSPFHTSPPWSGEGGAGRHSGPGPDRMGALGIEFGLVRALTAAPGNGAEASLRSGVGSQCLVCHAVSGACVGRDPLLRDLDTHRRSSPGPLPGTCGEQGGCPPAREDGGSR